MRVGNIKPLCLIVPYQLRNEMSLLRLNLLASRLRMNCSSVSFSFGVFESSFQDANFEIVNHLAICIKCNDRGRSFLCLIECA